MSELNIYRAKYDNLQRRYDRLGNEHSQLAELVADLEQRNENLLTHNETLSWELHQAHKVIAGYTQSHSVLKDENKMLRTQIELGFWGLIKKAFRTLIK